MNDTTDSSMSDLQGEKYRGTNENSKIPGHFDPSCTLPFVNAHAFFTCRFKSSLDKRVFAEEKIIRMRLKWFCCCYFWFVIVIVTFACFISVIFLTLRD